MPETAEERGREEEQEALAQNANVDEKLVPAAQALCRADLSMRFGMNGKLLSEEVRQCFSAPETARQWLIRAQKCISAIAPEIRREEREKCAQVLDAMHAEREQRSYPPPKILKEAAQAIRARGQHDQG
ncbi:MAG: hypothetical protein ACR2PW_04585 [Gammaproteobacteria bacterium]